MVLITYKYLICFSKYRNYNYTTVIHVAFDSELQLASLLVTDSTQEKEETNNNDDGNGRQIKECPDHCLMCVRKHQTELAMSGLI